MIGYVEVLAFKAGATSVITALNVSPYIAVNDTLTSISFFTALITDSGRPKLISIAVPAFSTPTTCPGETFSSTSEVTEAITPSSGAYRYPNCI